MVRVSGATKKPGEVNSVSQSQPRKKAHKGTVVVQVFKDRLRLCWLYLGKRFFLYIGLPDSKVNRGVTEEKARKREWSARFNIVLFRVVVWLIAPAVK